MRRGSGARARGCEPGLESPRRVRLRKTNTSPPRRGRPQQGKEVLLAAHDTRRLRAHLRAPEAISVRADTMCPECALAPAKGRALEALPVRADKIRVDCAPHSAHWARFPSERTRYGSTARPPARTGRDFRPRGHHTGRMRAPEPGQARTRSAFRPSGHDTRRLRAAQRAVDVPRGPTAASRASRP